MMTSVVGVEITKDLKYAKVYVSVMGSEEEKRVISWKSSRTSWFPSCVGSCCL